MRCSGSTSTQLPANCARVTRPLAQLVAQHVHQRQLQRARRPRPRRQQRSQPQQLIHGQAHRGAPLVGVQAGQRQQAAGPRVVPGARRLGFHQVVRQRPVQQRHQAVVEQIQELAPHGPVRILLSDLLHHVARQRRGRAGEPQEGGDHLEDVPGALVLLSPRRDARHQLHLADVSRAEGERRIMPEADGLVRRRPISAYAHRARGEPLQQPHQRHEAHISRDELERRVQLEADGLIASASLGLHLHPARGEPLEPRCQGECLQLLALHGRLLHRAQAIG